MKALEVNAYLAQEYGQQLVGRLQTMHSLANGKWQSNVKYGIQEILEKLKPILNELQLLHETTDYKFDEQLATLQPHEPVLITVSVNDEGMRLPTAHVVENKTNDAMWILHYPTQGGVQQPWGEPVANTSDFTVQLEASSFSDETKQQMRLTLMPPQSRALACKGNKPLFQSLLDETKQLTLHSDGRVYERPLD